MTGLPDDTAARLQALAAAVGRLRPEHCEVYYERRSEIVAALRALARSPLVVRTVVQFAAPAPLQAAPTPPPELLAARVPPPPPAAQCAPRRARRHRYPHPGRPCAGQGALPLPHVTQGSPA
jgi:hypothetical protein